MLIIALCAVSTVPFLKSRTVIGSATNAISSSRALPVGKSCLACGFGRKACRDDLPSSISGCQGVALPVAPYYGFLAIAVTFFLVTTEVVKRAFYARMLGREPKTEMAA